MPRLTGTTEQQLIHLNMHWGNRYDFTAPQRSGDKWTATARFSDHDELQGESAAELLLAVRTHYAANKPGAV
jgi:hypothetical protein